MRLIFVAGFFCFLSSLLVSPRVHAEVISAKVKGRLLKMDGNEAVVQIGGKRIRVDKAQVDTSTSHNLVEVRLTPEQYRMLSSKKSAPSN